MMNNEFVSVLIPMYNRENFILDAIKSVLHQNYPYFKIILFDDGSTDSTLRIVNDFRKNLPVGVKERIQVIHGKGNKGIGYSRNQLLENIMTPYACWLDSDDLMTKDRLKIQLGVLKKTNSDIVFCHLQRFVIVENKFVATNIITIDTKKYSTFDSLKFNTATATGLFKSHLKEYLFLNSLTLGGEDILWLYQLVKNGIKITQVDQPLYLYRNHSNRIGVIKRLEENMKLKNEEDNILSVEIKRLDNL